MAVSLFLRKHFERGASEQSWEFLKNLPDGSKRLAELGERLQEVQKFSWEPRTDLREFPRRLQGSSKHSQGTGKCLREFLKWLG